MQQRDERVVMGRQIPKRLLVGIIGIVAVLGLGACSNGPQPGEQRAAPLFDNLGTHHHAITTSSPLAQRYFDQGLIWCFAFNHAEAIRSFREAARLDPDCAMCYWGVAYALGPNINAPMDAEAGREAFLAIQEAYRRAGKTTKREQDYILSLATRYASHPPEDRSALDRAYADAMRELARRYPDDLDAATLFAEALMDTTPWNYWTAEGRPGPVTEEIVGTLESVLARAPEHPFALHLYIHAVEASADPGRAEAVADRLMNLVPGAGHLVHMPAHIYLRVGRYEDVARLNELAAKADEAYFAQAQAQGLYPAAYYPHNIHFLWQSAMIEGRSALAIEAGKKIAQVLSAEQIEDFPMVEPLVSTEPFALVQFGRWAELLRRPAPNPEFKYATAIWQYARGLAFAALGQVEEARRELASLEVLAKSEEWKAYATEVPTVPLTKMVEIARHVLAAKIAGGKEKKDEQIRHLKEGVRLEDDLPYMEPPFWPTPVRQSLGAVLLVQGRAKEAEAVYREDLKRHPRNGWSLFGLAQSLRAQEKTMAAKEAQRQFEDVWARADVNLQASRF
jgi:tetratricopeptide (TPR) repeat protein